MCCMTASILKRPLSAIVREGNQTGVQALQMSFRKGNGNGIEGGAANISENTFGSLTAPTTSKIISLVFQ